MVEAFLGQPEEDQSHCLNFGAKIVHSKKVDDSYPMKNVLRSCNEVIGTDEMHEDERRISWRNLP